MHSRKKVSIVRRIVRRLVVIGGACVLTLAFFLVLPLIQAISRPPVADLMVRDADVADVPPPPPPPEQEPEEEPEPEEPPPQLQEEAPPLDLSELAMALTPGFGEGWMGGDLAIDLGAVAAAAGAVDDLLTGADLDQRPRVIHQPGPVLDGKARARAPGTVKVIFVVDERGGVESPVVQSSTDAVFDRPVLAAVKSWKFEPGKRNGQPVRFRMRVPVTIPEG